MIMINIIIIYYLLFIYIIIIIAAIKKIIIIKALPIKKGNKLIPGICYTPRNSV